MADDILELNDEGEFVVPASKPKNLDSVPVVKKNTPETIKQAVSKGTSSSVSNSSDILSSISSGEYKVYAYDSKVDVVVRLETAKETVRSVNVSAEKIITIESSSGARLAIDICDIESSVSLMAESATACNFEDYCVISWK
jgi:hypothetical protein